MHYLKYLFLVLTVIACTSVEDKSENTDNISSEDELNPDSVQVEKPLYCNATCRVGAERTSEYLSLLTGKKVGIVGNQSSMINETHLVDSLLSLDIDIERVFSPEHGFRGDADAGETVENGIDSKTGLEIVSLYGKNKKPTKTQLEGIEILVFDIQDVGARFYTYISTLHYVMEAAAENNIELIVLDRPNPNGHYVDGPVLQSSFSSFVGMHEIPVVHGMTIGEYAQMINGEKWLNDGVSCQLKVITCEGWDHNEFYELPIAPSPNLPNMRSVYLYPSLCFFEGTVVSIGRGTDFPFQIVGHPDFEVDLLEDLYSFKPMPNDGASHPKLEGETCYGYSFGDDEIKELRENAKLDLSYLVEFYSQLNNEKNFFLSNNFINLLAGSDQLKKQIQKGSSIEEIEASWQDDLNIFKNTRSKYLLYEDFKSL